jgi:predicted Zn-dependent peptidase
MDFKLHKMPSGLKVLTVPMPSLESATLTIWVKTGSRNEESKISGISHFLEHMVFKGSKKRPTAREISQAVDALGGEFNAGTEKDWTNFYIKVRKDNIEMAFDVLSDMVFNPILDPVEIEREKGTIIQEIRMYEDTPMMKIGDIFEELTFAGNPLGRDTAGTEGSVKGIEKNDFEVYRKIHYYPENMVVTVAGGIDDKRALELVGKYFGNLKTPASPARQVNRKFEAQIFKSDQTEPQFKLKTKKSEQAHLILGFMGEGKSYEGRFAQGLLSIILGVPMSSRLFIEVRERHGLAYAVRTSMTRYQEVGYMGTYAGVNVTKVEEAIKVILGQCYGLASKKYPVTEKELAKAKGFLKGTLALTLEDTRAVNEFFGSQELFLSKVLTPEEIYKKVDKVTLDDIYFEAKKLFTPERLSLAVIGPYSDSKKFTKLLK